MFSIDSRKESLQDETQRRKPKRKVTEVPQSSDPTKHVADEAVKEEMNDSLKRVATTATSLDAEQDRGNIFKTQSKATPNEPGSQGTSSGGGPTCQETIRDTTAQTSLKGERGQELIGLKDYKVGLSARVESSEDESLGEDDASKHRRIADIDANEDIYLVNVHNDKDMFDVDQDLAGEEVVKAYKTQAKAKGIIFHEPEEFTTTTAAIPKPKSQDKGKAKMIEEPMKLKKKDQIQLDEEVALKLQGELQAEFEKEQRLASERAQQEVKANIALIESWDDIQAKIDADYQLAERLEAEEQQELNDEEKATLFMQLLKKRRKFFEAKRSKEKRNKSPTQAQQRKIMCTYLKNMQGKKLTNLKDNVFFTKRRIEANVGRLWTRAGDRPTGDKTKIKASTCVGLSQNSKSYTYFRYYKDAKSLFVAIETRFGGNEATKMTQKTLLKKMYENFSAPSTKSLDFIFNRLQTIISQLAVLGEFISHEDLNLKFLRSLPSEWNTHVVVWRNKHDLDTMSIDDLYNNFKIVKQELIHKDLEQIYEDYLEEMDLKWQLALLSMREKSYNVVPPPATLVYNTGRCPLPKTDLSYSGLEEFKQPQFESYGPKSCEIESKNAKKKTLVPTMNKVKAVRPKQQEKPVKKTVRYAEMYRSQGSRGNQRNWNNLKSQQLGSNLIQVSDGLSPKRKLISLFCVHGHPQKDMLPLGDEQMVAELLMRDRKNNVLFTETKCLVLPPNFKLPVESQILLRVPIQNNMYSVDMKNIVPKERLTCLVAKATHDESMLCHMRLADSKLPTTFWAEAINTACYVQNRALVVKPHNKTLYELFRGRTPALSFMRPFGCHGTIFNTIDYLGKFDGKADECYFVGYSMNSKAIRVYNIRTRRVEENLHIKFLKNMPIVTGAEPEWLFDINMLTKSMNYVPVIACTNSNDFAGTKDSIGACQSSIETGSTQDYIFMPLWKDGLPLFYSSPKISSDDGKKHDEVSDKESGVSNELNSAFENLNTEYPYDPKMPGLETIATYDDSEEEADFTNLESSIHVSPTPTTRTHKNHTLKQYLRDSSFELVAYGDGDYAGASLDRKSTTGGLSVPRKQIDIMAVQEANCVMVTMLEQVWIGSLQLGGCQFLGSRLISWQCKKQIVVATSTAEAEYMAAASCCGQVNQSSVDGFGEMIQYNLITGLRSAAKDKCKAVRLQEELDEEERQRMARVHEAAQSFFEEEWENIRARVEADEELTHILQAEERNKRVNTFIPMEIEDKKRASKLEAGSSQATITDSAEARSSKRATEAELYYEGSKRQKTNEASGSKQPDEEENELSQEDLQQMMMVKILKDHQDRVVALETDLKQTKKVYGAAYTKLIMKVKKLENTVKTSQAKRRAKSVVSDNEEDLEDLSKHGRKIDEIDQDPNILLIQHDAEIQGRYDQDMEFNLDFD
nr:hypothetical protein [Tanacetum cinerariifolium]